MFDDYSLQVGYDTSLHVDSDGMHYSYLLNLLANPIWFMRILGTFLAVMLVMIGVSLVGKDGGVIVFGNLLPYVVFVTLYGGFSICITLLGYVAFCVFIMPYRRYEVSLTAANVKVIVYRNLNRTRGHTYVISYTKVYCLSVFRSLNLIRLRTMFGSYDVYVGDAEFDTVFEYLKQRCKRVYIFDTGQLLAAIPLNFH